MKKRSQKSVLWLKIQLRRLKQHLYWLPIKHRVDYQILLPDNYESRLDVDGEQPGGTLTQFGMFDSLTLTRNGILMSGMVSPVQTLRPVTSQVGSQPQQM